MSIPRARTRVHGLGGHVGSVSARARFAARCAGRWSVAGAKIALWLLVVTSSLLAIVLLASHGTTYRDPDVDQLERGNAARARLELGQRAIAIDHVIARSR